MTPFKIALAVLVAALAAGCGGRKQPSHTNKDVAMEIQRAMNVRAVSNNVPGSAFVCTQHAKGESPLPMFCETHSTSSVGDDIKMTWRIKDFAWSKDCFMAKPTEVYENNQPVAGEATEALGLGPSILDYLGQDLPAVRTCRGAASTSARTAPSDPPDTSADDALQAKYDAEHGITRDAKGGIVR